MPAMNLGRINPADTDCGSTADDPSRPNLRRDSADAARDSAWRFEIEAPTTYLFPSSTPHPLRRIHPSTVPPSGLPPGFLGISVLATSPLPLVAVPEALAKATVRARGTRPTRTMYRFPHLRLFRHCDKFSPDCRSSRSLCLR
jgi:hypothetical protein